MADQLGRQGGDEYYADLDLISNVLDEKERQGIDLIQDNGYGGEDAGGDDDNENETNSPSADRFVLNDDHTFECRYYCFQSKCR